MSEKSYVNVKSGMVEDHQQSQHKNSILDRERTRALRIRVKEGDQILCRYCYRRFNFDDLIFKDPTITMQSKRLGLILEYKDCVCRKCASESGLQIGPSEGIIFYDVITQICKVGSGWVTGLTTKLVADNYPQEKQKLQSRGSHE